MWPLVCQKTVCLYTENNTDEPWNANNSSSNIVTLSFLLKDSKKIDVFAQHLTTELSIENLCGFIEFYQFLLILQFCVFLIFRQNNNNSVIFFFCVFVRVWFETCFVGLFVAGKVRPAIPTYRKIQFCSLFSNVLKEKKKHTHTRTQTYKTQKDTHKHKHTYAANIIYRPKK